MVHRNVSVENNAATVDEILVADNMVKRDLTCEDNDPDPTLSGNQGFRKIELL